MDNKRHQNIVTAIASYGKGLLGFIRKRVQNDADAEDILQDVWYQLSSVINAQPVEQTGAWLYRVAHNKIIDKHRKKSELSWQNESDDPDSSFSYDQTLKADHTPETVYFDRIIWQEVFMALDELPVEQKKVFIWHELDGISFAEIAERTGEPVGKLISRKHYAVRHLRKRLRVLYAELTE